MSFYPILSAPGCTGWTTLCNFPPNNWEATRVSQKAINVTWSDGEVWCSESLGTLAANEARTVSATDLLAQVPKRALAFLSLSSSPYPRRSPTLPASDAVATAVPAWRAALGLSSHAASTCYQGEIDPFPSNGTLLTFCPFLQFGEGVENYMLFLNLEKAPANRSAELEIRLAEDMSVLRAVVPVRSNDLSVISLDGLGFGPDDLPTILCRGMSGIPLYFSRTADGAYLSMEHTHPPASYVIHGKRWEMQKLIKNAWFAKAGQS